jgi:acyl carrier protein
MNIKEKVYKVISETLSIDPSIINEDLEVGGIKEWDSLGQVNLIVSLEKEFELTFDVDETLEMDNVFDIVDILEQRFKEDE